VNSNESAVGVRPASPCGEASQYETCAPILTQVATANRPATAQVVAALLATEKELKKTKQEIPFAAILGTWRFCFASGAKKTKQGLRLGQGYYVPSFVRATISFAAETSATGTVTNQLLIGPLGIRFSGPCRYPGKMNILSFDFTYLEMLVGSKVLYSRSIRSGGAAEFMAKSTGKLPFFVFLWASPTEIAARGKGGGLAIWVKEGLD
jgi:hypothetical protein